MPLEFLQKYKATDIGQTAGALNPWDGSVHAVRAVPKNCILFIMTVDPTLMVGFTVIITQRKYLEVMN